MLLEPLYEEDFYDFSYGFRPRCSAHNAIDALRGGINRCRGGWVLDADISAFFDTLDHKILRDLLSQRMTDGSITRLIGKWLNAGVLEDGVVTHAAQGTPQGGVISPLLANIYLHTVLDDWWIRDVLPRMRGKVALVRYADDFVMVFSNREDALRVHEVLPERFARFGLTLHPEKTRLVRFLPPKVKGQRSGSFDFLGFTFYWGRSRRGRWVLKQKTAKGRLSRGLKALSRWMRAARHLPLKKQARTLSRKLQGHFNYYGIRGNSKGIARFHYEAGALWFKWLGRRSQRAVLTWAVFKALWRRLGIPPPRIRRDARANG